MISSTGIPFIFYTLSHASKNRIQTQYYYFFNKCTMHFTLIENWVITKFLNLKYKIIIYKMLLPKIASLNVNGLGGFKCNKKHNKITRSKC